MLVGAELTLSKSRPRFPQGWDGGLPQQVIRNARPTTRTAVIYYSAAFFHLSFLNVPATGLLVGVGLSNLFISDVNRFKHILISPLSHSHAQRFQLLLLLSLLGGYFLILGSELAPMAPPGGSHFPGVGWPVGGIRGNRGCGRLAANRGFSG